MNIIAIDPSLISTSVIVGDENNFKIFNYCREKDAYGKKGLKKWYKLAEELIEYKFISYRKFENYSEGELTKLKDYDKITDSIIDDILDNIDINEETIIGIEGYNFGAQVGDLLDLVTFSTLLRKKLYDEVSTNIEVFSPSTLKLESCKLTYEPIIKKTGKRVIKIKEEWRNNLGIAGGNFTKRDMCLAIVENNKLDDPWIKHCKLVKDDLFSISKISKPYEDTNDSYLIYQYLKAKY